MPIASKKDRLSRLQTFCSDRYRDIAVQCRIKETGALGPIYGGRWDLHEARYCEPWEIKYHIRSAATPDEAERAALDVHRMDISAKQSELIEDLTTPLIMANGTRRAGKSRGHAGKGVIHSAAYPMLGGEMISPTYPKAGIVWRYVRQMMPSSWVESTNQARMVISLWNGSVIRFLSAHKPDSLIGEGVGWIGFDEFQSITENAFGLALPALSDGGSAFQAWGAGTPRMGEYRTRFERFKSAEKHGRAKVMRFTYRDNPFIESGEGSIFDLARDVMDPRKMEQELEARFVSEEGLVYYRFDRQVHARSWERHAAKTVDVTADYLDEKLEAEGNYLIGVDYGINRQFAVVYKIVRINGHVCLWAIDEILLYRNADLQRLAFELLERGYGPAVIIDDASGPKSEGGRLSAWRLEDARDRYGNKPFKVRHYTRNRSVQGRVSSVNAMMGTARAKGMGPGTVRFFIDTDACPDLTFCFENQELERGKPKRSVGTTKTLHDPPDAAGYPIHYLFPADVDFEGGERLAA